VSKIEIYTAPFCGFCMQAKGLLDRKGVDYHEIDVSMTPGARQEMIEKTGRTSVPQVFVDGDHIGDCDGIHMLDARGELDLKLGLAGQD
jgi:glutaredoxin 3